MRRALRSDLRSAQGPSARMLSDMNAKVAYVKLGWVLGHGLNPAEEMPKDCLGEVSKRTEEGFGVGTGL